MPTPFTHLEFAQRLMADSAIPAEYRELINANRPAFLLGNIAADARIEGNINRSDTHFYSYASTIEKHPWVVMLHTHEALKTVKESDHCAFLAGYVAHLSVDEFWAKNMVYNHFMHATWGKHMDRYIGLALMLIHMDQRDLNRLEPWQADTLDQVSPNYWLPFIPDQTLVDWAGFITKQLKDDSMCQTIDIFSSRMGLPPLLFESILNSRQSMQEKLWDHVPANILGFTEKQMYEFTREQLLRYFQFYALAKDIAE